jgi:lipoprotein-anchoring transpeptidase ErfK/SrfK
MAFYYIDVDANSRVLLKTYRIGVGKQGATPSGNLTPIGRFILGDKIAVYNPGIMGLFQDKEVEMIRVFGTRWIPFGSEIGDVSHPAKGLGLHGAPCSFDEKGQRWVESRNVIGTYESDGCIRMLSEDIEEIFSIVITKKPTIIEIVNRFEEAEIPGIEGLK